MAGTLNVDTLKADSNLRLQIASANVAFIDANGLTIVGNSLNVGGGRISVTSNSAIINPTITTPTVSGNLNLDSTGTSGVRSPAANTLAFYTAGTEDIRITSNGWVGVGTTTPANTFSVKGGSIVAERDVDTDRLSLSYADINIFANATGGTNHNAFTIRHSNNSVSNNRLRVTATGLFQFDSGYGDIATAYGCRAWVNFNGTGTVAIRASGNVTSITDNGTGDYTVNFTNAMPDVNYSVVCGGKINDTTTPDNIGGPTNGSTINPNSYGTGSVRMVTISSYGGSATDFTIVNIAVFR
jgi:hypothetical protein